MMQNLENGVADMGFLVVIHRHWKWNIQQITHDFLSSLYSNYIPILCRFQDTVTY